MAFTLCFTKTNCLSFTFLLIFICLLKQVSSMDGLSPVTYQDAFDGTRRNENTCQVCNSDYKKQMMLRGNDEKSQMNFFLKSLGHKDFSLLELQEQIRVRCASFSCLKEAVTKGDVYSKLPICKAFMQTNSAPGTEGTFLTYLQSRVSNPSDFLDKLDKCSSEVSGALTSFNDDTENGKATKAGLDALSNIINKFNGWARSVKEALKVYDGCKDIFNGLPSTMEGIPGFIGKIKTCMASVEKVQDALPRSIVNFVTEMGKFTKAIESIAQITQNLPNSIDEMTGKFQELRLSLTLISGLNLPASAKEKISVIVQNIQGYANIAEKLLVAFSFEMNLDVNGVKVKLSELNAVANEVKQSTVKIPKQIVLIATKASEYTPILLKLIDAVSTISGGNGDNNGDFLKAIKMIEEKITEIKGILTQLSKVQDIPPKMQTIVGSVQSFLTIGGKGVKAIQQCLGVINVFDKKNQLEWDTLKGGLDKLNTCRIGLENMKLVDSQQKQQQGGFLQTKLEILQSMKDKVLKLVDPFFGLINGMAVCTEAATSLDSRKLNACAESIDKLPILEEKGKPIKAAVVASIKIIDGCQNIFELDFDINFNELLQTVKEMKDEVKGCLNTVDEELESLGKFGEAVSAKLKSIKAFKTKIEKMGPMALITAFTACNNMITNGEALRNTVQEAQLPMLQNQIVESGGNIYTWVQNVHEQVEVFIENGKGNAEQITTQFKNLQSSAKDCQKAIVAVTDLLPEKWQIRSKFKNLGKSWTQLKISPAKALVSNNWWSRTKSWGKKLARGGAKVIRAAGGVAGKVFRLAGTLLGPLTECIAALSEDDEETYKSEWRKCFEAGCKAFDDAVHSAAAAFVGATAATPLCAKVAAASSAIPVVGSVGGGTLCLLAASGIAAEAADRAYQNSNLDKAADKACENYANIRVEDITDGLIDKVDDVMEMLSCPRLLEEQRNENDLGECRRKDGAGSWWSCDTSSDCEPDPDNPCKGICVCDEEWNNSCECVSTKQKATSC